MHVLTVNINAQLIEGRDWHNFDGLRVVLVQSVEKGPNRNFPHKWRVYF
jgi:hypothetical protein